MFEGDEVMFADAQNTKSKKHKAHKADSNQNEISEVLFAGGPARSDLEDWCELGLVNASLEEKLDILDFHESEIYQRKKKVSWRQRFWNIHVYLIFCSVAIWWWNEKKIW